MKNEIAMRLKMLRETRGVTRREVAENTGIAYTTYCHYEDGSMDLKASALVKLAIYYQMSADWILGQDPPDEKSPPPANKWEALEQSLEKLSDSELKEVWSFVKFLYWRKTQGE